MLLTDRPRDLERRSGLENEPGAEELGSDDGSLVLFIQLCAGTPCPRYAHARAIAQERGAIRRK